ncbi:MAG TPA: hypothetical protein VM660_01040 [Bacillus sp. (in: firmicutes)]|jgi:hypothetical protein|nr:hypothetical protein [Bacillus sp. (in: firmicutes)]
MSSHIENGGNDSNSIDIFQLFGKLLTTQLQKQIENRALKQEQRLDSKND